VVARRDTALKNNGIGWTLWDYSSTTFGLVTKNADGKTVADEGVLKALGMK